MVLVFLGFLAEQEISDVRMSENGHRQNGAHTSSNPIDNDMFHASVARTAPF